jgi:isocitrate lyase
MSNCTGCQSSGATPHTPECLFAHFLAYTGYHQMSWATQQLLKTAYEHGMREGAKLQAKIQADEVSWVRNQLARGEAI